MNDFERTLRHRLSSIISKDSKPKIGILMPKTGIVWDDLMGGIGEANKHYSFVVFKCPMNNPKEIAVCLSDMDQAGFDAIALIRGGGNFLESLDTPVVLKAIAKLETPFMIAAGHFVDNPVVQMIASMTCGTPTMLGVELGRIVEAFKREKKIDQGLQKNNPGILENDEYIPNLIPKISKEKNVQPDSPKIDQEFNYSDFFMSQCKAKQKKEPEKTICKAQAAFTKFVAFIFLVLMIPLFFLGETNSKMNFIYAMLLGSSIFACINVYVSKRTYTDNVSPSKSIKHIQKEDDESILDSDGVIDDGLGFLDDDNFMFSGFDF